NDKAWEPKSRLMMNEAPRLDQALCHHLAPAKQRNTKLPVKAL
ncbi:hypothetical protein CEXT_150171, partial [Caerostris extrusa]